jgi:hypothetical protein
MSEYSTIRQRSRDLCRSLVDLSAPPGFKLSLGVSALARTCQLPHQLIFALLFGFAGPLSAAEPKAETLFPQTTVGFVSVADANDARERWERTQFGQMANDKAFKPFVEHIRTQLNERFGNLPDRLGVTWEELSAAAGGEAAIGMVAKQGRTARLVAVVDTTGHATERETLLGKIDVRLTERGAKKAIEDVAGVKVTTYTLPLKEDETKQRTATYFTKGELLCGSDDLAEAKALLASYGGAAKDRLTANATYSETFRRVNAESKSLEPTLTWFIDPFAFDSALRTVAERKNSDNRDLMRILQEQGFGAIKGVGGHVTLSPDLSRDVVHRTAVYAPPKAGATGKKAVEKYDLAMRMLELGNRDDLTAEEWVPRMVASYRTVSIDVQNAFDNVASIFDAMAGYEDAFKTTMEGFEKDPFGPKINIRKELVEHLGSRVTVVTDYSLPITPDCERYLIVIDAKNPEALSSSIGKLMESDGAEVKKVGDQSYWELVPEEEVITESGVDSDLLDLGDGSTEEAADGPTEDRVLRRAAVCVHKGRLVIASDVELLEQALFGVTSQEQLSGAMDYQAAMDSLGELIGPQRCVVSFTRGDEALRPSYELLRAGQMPKSQTFFGRFLNEMFTSKEDEEKGIARKQQINASDLPSFEVARRYFAPVARAIRSDDDGWFITGVLLNKGAETPEIASAK